MSNREIITLKLLEKFCGGVTLKIGNKTDIAFSSASLISKIGGVWNGDELLCSEFSCEDQTYFGFYEDDCDVIAKTLNGEIVL